MTIPKRVRDFGTPTSRQGDNFLKRMVNNFEAS